MLNSNEKAVAGVGDMSLLEQAMSDGSKGYAVSIQAKDGDSNPVYVVLEMKGTKARAMAFLNTLDKRVSHVEVR